MKHRRPLVFVAAMCALVASVVAVDAAWRPAEGSGISITADVDQAPNLFEGGRVMVRGVEVGRIVAVDPGPESVRLTMQIDDGVPIAADATLQVVPITVIADRYVQLSPYESGPKMESGAHIPIVRTQIPAELDEVLGELKDLIDAFGRRPGQEQGPLAKLVAAVDEAVEGRGAQLSRTLESSASVLSNLAASQSDIQRLVQNVDRLFVSLANASSRFGLLNERFALVATALRDDQDALEGTIENLQFLSQQAADVVLESGDDLGESFGRLDVVLGTILEHQNAVTRGARWTNAVAQALGATDARGRGRFAYTGKQGGNSSSYNYRLDQRDTIACQRLAALSESYNTLFDFGSEQEFLDFTSNGALTYLPETYRDDVEWLIRLLLHPCGLDQLDDPPPTGLKRELNRLAEEIGRDRLAGLLAQWFATGFVEEPSP
ncbi:MAG: MCE family protein [Actinomycetota bacterium]